MNRTKSALLRKQPHPPDDSGTMEAERTKEGTRTRQKNPRRRESTAGERRKSGKIQPAQAGMDPATWNPPSSGASVASYKVAHAGNRVTKYVWSPGVTVPAGYEPWSGGECTVSGSTTTCSIVADSFSHDTRQFSVTARTADETEGTAAYTSVEVDDCSGSGTTTTTTTTIDAVPGTVRDLTVTQTSGTLNVVVAWNKPTSQSGVSEPTSYTVTGNGNPITHAATACTRSNPSCSYAFRSVPAGPQTFSVAATNGHGTGTAVEKIIAVQALSRPAAPTNLQASQVGDTQNVRLTWTAPGGTVTQYTVRRDGTDNRTVETSACSGTNCLYTFPGVLPGAPRSSRMPPAQTRRVRADQRSRTTGLQRNGLREACNTPRTSLAPPKCKAPAHQDLQAEPTNIWRCGSGSAARIIPNANSR